MRKIEKWRVCWSQCPSRQTVTYQRAALPGTITRGIPVTIPGYAVLEHPGWINFEALGITPEQYAEDIAQKTRQVKCWRLWDAEFPGMMLKRQYPLGSFEEFCKLYRIRVHRSGTPQQVYCRAFMNRKQLDGFLWQFR